MSIYYHTPPSSPSRAYYPSGFPNYRSSRYYDDYGVGGGGYYPRKSPIFICCLKTNAFILCSSPIFSYESCFVFAISTCQIRFEQHQPWHPHSQLSTSTHSHRVITQWSITYHGAVVLRAVVDGIQHTITIHRRGGTGKTVATTVVDHAGEILRILPGMTCTHIHFRLPIVHEPGLSLFRMCCR